MTARICVALTIGLACSRAADIRTIAGTGKPGHSGDGGPAAAAELNNPYGMTLGPDGALYICEVDSNVVRRMDLKTGRLSTVAGNGQKGYSGDGGPAIEASLNQPYEILFDPAGTCISPRCRITWCGAWTVRRESFRRWPGPGCRDFRATEVRRRRRSCGSRTASRSTRAAKRCTLPTSAIGAFGGWI